MTTDRDFRRLLQWEIIGVLLMIGFFLVVNVFPRLKTIHQLQAERNVRLSEKDSISQEVRAARIAAGQEKIQRLEEGHQQIQSMLEVMVADALQETSIPLVIVEIEEIIRRSGMNVNRIKPGSRELQNGYLSLPVDLHIVGPFTKLASLFRDFDQVSPLILVEQIQVIAGVSPQVDIRLQLRCFLSDTQQEQELAEKGSHE